MEWLQNNWITVAIAAYAFLSEVIGLNPAWKTNTVIQVVMGILGKLLGKKEV